ncbi:type I 3-dehydroquinate dehydratase [Oceanobacillus piezotolerans]|uniref:3-dehydroquinate dehydratase n=1 Tax=Oceanobacillus piezotolerans TaxID=2448030 RepID=A0A498D6R9_9BACI|nr:type I 3-dehydroquinate dehydratase [Oceanobacillus piezotolerans]RLL41290.1 type I 3-dehydroquinate dehydratase [Oceanobacillus piezotolerans]
MFKPVKVRDLAIGEGIPKICVPMVGKTTKQLVEEAKELTTLDYDVVEWRVDFFEQVEEIEKVKEALKEIRSVLPKAPLIFTFRSAREGGEKEVSSKYYKDLNLEILKTKEVDIIDVELFNDEENIKTLVSAAHENNVLVIISNHDFDKTPDKNEIVSRLMKAQDLGADLPKIAVMPNNTADVITLLDATREMAESHANRPIITMSMAGKGVISRLAGEVFGSALTFGAAKQASAPGQIAVKQLKDALHLLHQSL